MHDQRLALWKTDLVMRCAGWAGSNFKHTKSLMLKDGMGSQRERTTQFLRDLGFFAQSLSYQDVKQTCRFGKVGVASREEPEPMFFFPVRSGGRMTGQSR